MLVQSNNSPFVLVEFGLSTHDFEWTDKFWAKNIPFQESLGCQPLVCKWSQNCAAAQISGGKVQVRRPRSPSSRNNKTKIARLMGDAWLGGNEKVGCWEKRRKIKMDSREEGQWPHFFLPTEESIASSSGRRDRQRKPKGGKSWDEPELIRIRKQELWKV